MDNSGVSELITSVLQTTRKDILEVGGLDKRTIRLAMSTFTKKELDENKDFQSLMLLKEGLGFLAKIVKSQDSDTP
jgi:hypothetical protein